MTKMQGSLGRRVVRAKQLSSILSVGEAVLATNLIQRLVFKYSNKKWAAQMVPRASFRSETTSWDLQGVLRPGCPHADPLPRGSLQIPSYRVFMDTCSWGLLGCQILF